MILFFLRGGAGLTVYADVPLFFVKLLIIVRRCRANVEQLHAIILCDDDNG